jgi:membrane protein implicated in regulation of membrane protease activity
LLYALDGTVQIAGLLVLTVAAVYLLRPQVRARFLGSR